MSDDRNGMFALLLADPSSRQSGLNGHVDALDGVSAVEHRTARLGVECPARDLGLRAVPKRNADSRLLGDAEDNRHLTQRERISKLLGVLTLALCWCLLMGEWLHEQKPIAIKKHGRRAKSLFRNGLDRLRNIVLNLAVKEREFYWATTFLSCT